MTTGGSRAESLDLLLYIEGVPVPVISVTTTFAVHAAATAYVQVLATDEVLQLRPRSIVEVYYRQNDKIRDLSDVETLPFYRYDGSPSDGGSILRKSVPVSDVIDAVSNSTLYDSPITAEQAALELQYDLLFLGELSGYTFYEDSQSRTVNLMCVDFSNHLDNINMYTADLGQPATLGVYSRQTLLSGVNNSEELSRVRRGDAAVAKKLIAESEAKELAAATKKAAAAKTPEEAGSALYDAEGKPIVGDTVSVTDSGPDGSAKETAINIIAGGIIGLDQRIAKVLGDYGLRDGVRAIMASIANSYAFYLDIDEELNLRDQIFIDDDRQVAKIFRNASALDVIFGYQNRYGTINSLKNLIKIIFKLPHYDFCSLPGSPFYSTESYTLSETTVIADAKELKTSELAEQERVREIDTSDLIAALKQTLVKPEMYFAEPPACNIVFPDEMYSANISRHFFSEPTRGIDFTDHIVDQFGSATQSITGSFAITPIMSMNRDGEDISYTPPQMLDLVNKYTAQLEAFGQILLPEEVFKGVMPLQTSTPHALRAAAMGRLKESISGTIKGNPGEKIPLSKQQESRNAFFNDLEQKTFYVQEANYKFLVGRYQSRTAAISCKFLPRLLPGYTALVTEKAPLKNLEKAGNFFGFIGHVIQITHFVSQAGGVTSLNMSHVRPTNETLDFFELNGEHRTLTPDFRELGVLPFAYNPTSGTNSFGPKEIRLKYSEWFGGLDWRGKRIDESTAKDPGLPYYGIYPLSEAVASSPLSTDQDIEGLELGKDFLPYLRILFSRYQNEVVLNRDASAHVEAFIRDLTRRPVANKLQVRGYLNAYFTRDKHVTEQSKSSEKAKIRDRQRFLLRFKFFPGGGSPADIDGSIGSRTRSAIQNFQRFVGLPPTGEWDVSTQSWALATVDTNTVSPPDPPSTVTIGDNEIPRLSVEEARDLTSGLGTLDIDDSGNVVVANYGSDTLSNRIFRRGVRHGAVLDYVNSLAATAVSGTGLPG